MLRKFFSLILSFEGSGSVLDLHTKTKIYSSNDEDYYDGCEDFEAFFNGSLVFYDKNDESLIQ